MRPSRPRSVLFFKQKTAYEITYGDWSSDVCSSDLFEVAKTLFGLDSAGVIILTDSGTGQRDGAALHGDVAELVARAEDALERRDLALARATAQQAAALRPHDAVLHLLLGRISVAAGRSVVARGQLS